LAPLLLWTVNKQIAVPEQGTPMKALEEDTGPAHTLSIVGALSLFGELPKLCLQWSNYIRWSSIL